MSSATGQRLPPGSDLPELRKEITQGKINRYARVSGDGNPLHTDPEFAARSQFGGTIAHGMLVLAYLSEMLTRAFGGEWLARGRLKARFRAPARPGDKVIVSGRVEKAEATRIVCTVECRNQSDELLVSGEAEISLQGQ
ncbi:MAG TPA: MaoC family dehydratase [Dehalococcoidia bacterium]|nr:MaoC family dehydratase [Dehalococcoidia bacterium]